MRILSTLLPYVASTCLFGCSSGDTDGEVNSSDAFDLIIRGEWLGSVDASAGDAEFAGVIIAGDADSADPFPEGVAKIGNGVESLDASFMEGGSYLAKGLLPHTGNMSFDVEIGGERSSRVVALPQPWLEDVKFPASIPAGAELTLTWTATPGATCGVNSQGTSKVYQSGEFADEGAHTIPVGTLSSPTVAQTIELVCATTERVDALLLVSATQRRIGTVTVEP